MVRPRGTRQSVLWLACAIVAAAEVSPRTPLHAVAPDPAGGTFELVARHSGKCLDVNGASLDDFARVIQWDCHDGANQQWRFEPAGDGYYVLVARHSGKALDVIGESVENAAPIVQYTRSTGAPTSNGACSRPATATTR